MAFFTSLAPLSLAQADSPQQLACEGSGGRWDGGKCSTRSANGPTVSTTIKTAINILLFVVGVAAVIVVVIAGFRIVNSNGDAQQVTKAKDAIIYALVGVVVAISAYAIVNFILSQL